MNVSPGPNQPVHQEILNGQTGAYVPQEVYSMLSSKGCRSHDRMSEDLVMEAEEDRM